MYVDEKEQKVVQIIGNGYIHLENLKTVNNESVFTIRKGALAMQVNIESAEIICTTLQEWLKQKPLGA